MSLSLCELTRVVTSRRTIASLALILLLLGGVASGVCAQGLGADPGSFLDKLFGGSKADRWSEPSQAKTPPRDSAPKPAQSAATEPASAALTPQSLPIVQQFLLSGVVIADGTQMALLQEVGRSSQPPRFVHVGQAVGAYRLTSVEPDRVTLAGPGGEVVVLLGIGGIGIAALDPGTLPRSQPAAPVVPRAPVSMAPAPPPAPPPVVEGSGNQVRQPDRRMLKKELQQAQRELQQAQRENRRAGKAARTGGVAGSQAPEASE